MIEEKQKLIVTKIDFGNKALAKTQYIRSITGNMIYIMIAKVVTSLNDLHLI